MDNLSVLKKIEQQYENNLPFVLYSYPKKESVNFILQKDNLVYDTESSFKEYFIFLCRNILLRKHQNVILVII